MSNKGRNLYRLVLKTFERSILSEKGVNNLKRYLGVQFRMARTNGTDGNTIDEAEVLQYIEEYATLVQDIQNRKALLNSYNIGIPSDEREKTMNERAAQYVGLKLPRH